jgi:hypothetical protein
MISYVSNDPHLYNYIGKRQYELSNHLGNVLTVVSDRKFARDIDQNDEVDYFEPDILLTYDYSPFGVILKERAFEKQINSSAGSGYNTTNVSQTLRVRVKTTGGASNTNNGAYKLVTLTEANRPHTLTFDFSRTATPPFNNAVEVQLVNTTNPLDVLILTTLSTNGTYTYTFIPTDCENTEYKLSFTILGTVTGNRDFFLDNVIITANVCNYVDFGTYRYGFNGMEKDDEVKGSWQLL